MTVPDVRYPRPITAERQAWMMVLTNGAVLLVALGTLLIGYSRVHWPPIQFVSIELAICLGNLFALCPDFWQRFKAFLGDYPYAKSERMIAWYTNRGRGGSLRDWKSYRSLRGVTWLSAALSFYAVFDLVERTGKALDSPYAPLLVAPAVLGPYVVMNARALQALGFGALAWVVGADLIARSTRHSKLTAVSTDRPGWGVSAAVELVLVLGALSISYFQLRGPHGTKLISPLARAVLRFLRDTKACEAMISRWRTRNRRGGEDQQPMSSGGLEQADPASA